MPVPGSYYVPHRHCVGSNSSGSDDVHPYGQEVRRSLAEGFPLNHVPMLRHGSNRDTVARKGNVPGPIHVLAMDVAAFRVGCRKKWVA